jgi:hypothetical protein
VRTDCTFELRHRQPKAGGGTGWMYMKSRILLISMLTVGLFGVAKSAKAQEYYGQPQWGYERHEREEAWERRGFYDGARGADRDFGNHRRPDVNNRDEYRDPNLPRWAAHEYREGFRRGYYERVRQVYNGGRWRHDDDRRW